MFSYVHFLMIDNIYNKDTFNKVKYKLMTQKHSIASFMAYEHFVPFFSSFF